MLPDTPLLPRMVPAHSEFSVNTGLAEPSTPAPAHSNSQAAARAGAWCSPGLDPSPAPRLEWEDLCTPPGPGHAGWAQRGCPPLWAAHESTLLCEGTLVPGSPRASLSRWPTSRSRLSAKLRKTSNGRHPESIKVCGARHRPPLHLPPSPLVSRAPLLGRGNGPAEVALPSPAAG